MGGKLTDGIPALYSAMLSVPIERGNITSLPNMYGEKLDNSLLGAIGGHMSTS